MMFSDFIRYLKSYHKKILFNFGKDFRYSVTILTFFNFKYYKTIFNKFKLEEIQSIITVHNNYACG